MSSNIPLLSNVKVAAPCSASWLEMEAVDGDRVHFCAGCKENVYNLSAMTQTQAEGLLRKHEGHLCVRYYKRTDGTILTQNCPVGQAALRLKMIARSKRAALVTVAMVSLAAFGLTANAVYESEHITGRLVMPVHAKLGSSVAEPSQHATGQVPSSAKPERGFMMGAVYNEVVETPDGHNINTIEVEAKSLGLHVPVARAPATAGSLIAGVDAELRPPGATLGSR